jgi:hypothetical protein
MPGPEPRTLESWVKRIGRDHKGPKRLQLTCEDGKERVVKFTTAPKTIAIIQALHASRIEAIDAEGTILAQWDSPDPDTTPPEPAGYLKEPSDSDDERLLKTFAHLVADAHKAGNARLVEVIRIQAEAFGQDRKDLMTLRVQNEKLLGALARKGGPRVRIATEGEDGETEGASSDDAWLGEFLGPLVQRYMASQMAPQANGVAEHAEPAPTNGKGGAS